MRYFLIWGLFFYFILILWGLRFKAYHYLLVLRWGAGYTVKEWNEIPQLFFKCSREPGGSKRERHYVLDISCAASLCLCRLLEQSKLSSGQPACLGVRDYSNRMMAYHIDRVPLKHKHVSSFPPFPPVLCTEERRISACCLRLEASWPVWGPSGTKGLFMHARLSQWIELCH